MKDNVLEELRQSKKALDMAIDYIEKFTIDKQDLLKHLASINTPENSKAVATFRKFFEEDKEQDDR